MFREGLWNKLEGGGGERGGGFFSNERDGWMTDLIGSASASSDLPWYDGDGAG